MNARTRKKVLPVSNSDPAPLKRIRKNTEEVAEELKKIYIVTPFTEEPKIQVDRIVKLEKATARLTLLLADLVPKTSWADDNWDSSLAHELTLSYQGKGRLKPGQDNWKNSPAAHLLADLKIFEEILSVSKALVKPPRGNKKTNRPEGTVANLVVHFFVDEYFKELDNTPATTENGWAVNTLEEIFDKYKLGTGARHLLRKIVKKKAGNSP
jgi:hypothetical protein